MNLLLRKDAINQIMEEGDSWTSLSWVVDNELKTVTQQVLQMDGVDLSIADDYHQETPLFWAAENGYEAIVKLLLEKNVDLEWGCIDGNTPLSVAAGRGHMAIVKLLLEKGAKLESTDYMERTPLYLAASNGHEAIVNLLKSWI